MQYISRPTFILLNPQLGENIGAVARAMSNFGLTDLRIVAPRDGWPNEAAVAMAAHGKTIIEQALVVGSLKDALHDITMLYATTPRMDVLGKPVFTPREAMADIYRSEGAKSGNKTAILFGAERAGLSNEDIVLCDAIICIPVSKENPSLNLAQAAVVIGYEWHMFCHCCEEQRGEASHSSHIYEMSDGLPRRSNAPSRNDGDRATKADLEGLFEHAKELLNAVNYFREPNKAKLMWQHMRSIWTRVNLSQQEVRTLRGMIRAILRKLS